MDEFKDIRPYMDHEIRPVIEALLKDREFIGSVARFYFPRLSKLAPPLMNTLVRQRLHIQLKNVNSVATVQDVISFYMDKMIRDTTTSLSQEGLSQLDHSKNYLFISNHRDIAMDPAFVNYFLYHEGLQTLQIAIGDNLLKKPFVNDLMRLNKSFIVRRSLRGRELLKSLDLLSRYIHYSVEHNQNVWIAQREGRAKNGVDRTDPALLKMLARGHSELPLHASLERLHIVPVAISYEYDACDGLKAFELQQMDSAGEFVKSDQSDIQSIVTGILGYKGKVHVTFGTELQPESDDPEEIAAQIDKQIHLNYRLHDTNFLALQLLREQTDVEIPPLPEEALNFSVKEETRNSFLARMNRLDAPLRSYYLQMYANPVISHYQGIAKAN